MGRLGVCRPMDANAQQQRTRDETALLGGDIMDGPQRWAAARCTLNSKAECIDDSCLSLGALAADASFLPLYRWHLTPGTHKRVLCSQSDWLCSVGTGNQLSRSLKN